MSSTWGSHTERHRIVLFRALAVLAGSVAALICVELAVRVLSIGPRFNPIYKNAYRLSDNPVLKYELIPQARGPDFQINRHGLRGREYSLQKAANVFRIACIGDSIIYGLGAPQTQTYPIQLEQLLNRFFASPGRRFEVLNFGVPGYNATQVAECLRVQALAYDPDLIIYGYCLNDPSGYSLEFEALDSLLTPAQRNFRNRTLGGMNLASHSKEYLLLRYWWEARTFRELPGTELYEDPQWVVIRQDTYANFFRGLHEDPRSWARVERAMAQMAQLGRAHGATVHTVIFPIFKDLDDYQLAGAHAKTAAASEAAALGTIDLLEPYKFLHQAGNWSLASDDLHPGQAGYAFAAMVTIQELLVNGFLDTPATSIRPIAAQNNIEGDLAGLALRATGVLP